VTAPAPREAFGLVEQSDDGRRWFGGRTLFGDDIWVVSRRSAEILTRARAEELAVRYRQQHRFRTYEIRELTVMIHAGGS